MYPAQVVPKGPVDNTAAYFQRMDLQSYPIPQSYPGPPPPHAPYQEMAPQSYSGLPPQPAPYQGCGQQSNQGPPPASYPEIAPQSYPGPPPAPYQGNGQQSTMGPPPAPYQAKCPQSYPGLQLVPYMGYGQLPPTQQPLPPTQHQEMGPQSLNPGPPPTQLQKVELEPKVGPPQPTVKAAANFSAEADAELLRKAMRGMALIDIISQRSNQLRVEIVNTYKTMFGKDLISDLKSELSGDLEETFLALFKPAAFYDACCLRRAMRGAGTDESTLSEILCSRSNAEIREIKRCYQEYYNRDLEKDCVSETSGHFKRLLVCCCQANRDELTPEQWQKLEQEGQEAVVDRSLAQKEAQRLFDAGEKKWGTDESAFNVVLASRHQYQLRATFEEYAKISGRGILNSIDREMSGDLKEGFKAIVKCARNRPEYFADRLYRSMKGSGTDDPTLIRVIVSRSEIDLHDIKQAYLAKYKKPLDKAISGDTSGDYKKLLLALIGQ